MAFAGHHDQQPDPELEIDHDGCFPPHGVHEPCPANPCRDLPVYHTIHRVRREIIEAIGMFGLCFDDGCFEVGRMCDFGWLMFNR